MPALSKDDKLRLLRIILESRHADLREQNLIRQGKGHFHVSGMGHEALAAVSIQMEPDDYIVPYYRDRGLVLGRGMTTANSVSSILQNATPAAAGGRCRHITATQTCTSGACPRQPVHSFFRRAASPGASSSMERKMSLSRQSVTLRRAREIFSKRSVSRKKRSSPCSFSWRTTPTASACPRGKQIRSRWTFSSRTTGATIEGQDVQQVYDATAEAIEKIRAGGGPFFFWIKMERLSSHTSSDDQKLYRSCRGTAGLGKVRSLNVLEGSAH